MGTRYERVPNILRYSFNNHFIIYPLISNGGMLIPVISRPVRPLMMKLCDHKRHLYASDLKIIDML